MTIKKVLAIAMATLLMAGMASCGGNTESSENTEATIPDYGQQIKDNKTIGREFMEQNAKNDSVVQTKSGLQYMVLKEGTGAKPEAEDTVIVNYVGTLLDGTEFDSSAKHGGTAKLPLNTVIPGWAEGLQLMSEGSKFRLFVPSELAYGSRGAGKDILPNSTLIFDVELVKVIKKQ